MKAYNEFQDTFRYILAIVDHIQRHMIGGNNSPFSKGVSLHHLT